MLFTRLWVSIILSINIVKKVAPIDKRNVMKTKRSTLKSVSYNNFNLNL